MLKPEFDREQLRKFNKYGYRSVAARYAQSAELMLIELEAELQKQRLEKADAWEKLDVLEASIEHIKAWASQPTIALKHQQILDAVIRMCDDALMATGKPPDENPEVCNQGHTRCCSTCEINGLRCPLRNLEGEREFPCPHWVALEARGG